jgi:hypothetical protein
MALSGAERTVPREIEAAEDCWTSTLDRTPQQFPTLIAGGKTILLQPKPWDPSWAAILRYLDGAFGTRRGWTHEADTWEQRMKLMPHEIAELTRLEGEVERTRGEMAAARERYVGVDRERRRRERVLARAPYDHDMGRVMVPADEKVSERDFAQLAQEFLRREEEFLRVREEHERALGAVLEYKGKIQKQRNYSPWGDFD